MGDFAADQWMPILSRLNVVIQRERKEELTAEASSSGWCGSPPASESEILEAEKRLGLTLPPSYRAFLATSNGWQPFGSFIERLLPVGEVERLAIAAPWESTEIQKFTVDDDATDDEYLDYETPEHNELLRRRYYPDCLLVGKAWQGGGGELTLLNPHIIFANGEWETIFFGCWVPGNRRYRSFYDFVADSVSSEEELEKS